MDMTYICNSHIHMLDINVLSTVYLIFYRAINGKKLLDINCK